MAPFNTHLLIAETLWSELVGPWQNEYGQFCFGCIAPDVDKVSVVLTQKDTHFFDRTTDYELMISHRSATFIERQANFFSLPFAQLPPMAQAFVLGYLCHLCVDEVSKCLWQRETYAAFTVSVGSAFAALDEVARQRIKNRSAMVKSLCELKPLSVIPRIPSVDLESTHRGLCNFVTANDTEGEYLALVDLFDQATPAERQHKRQQFQANIDLARRQIHHFRMDKLIETSLSHSRSRLTDLLDNRIPSPSRPVFVA